MDFIAIFEKTKFWTKSLAVIAYLYRSRDDGGYIFTTYKKIREATNVSVPIIARVMTELQADGVLKKIQNGVWTFTDIESHAE